MPVHPLKIALAERGLTYKEFAPRVGVTVPSFTQMVNFRVASWPALRRRCAAELGVPEAQLFPDDGHLADRPHSSVAS